MGSLINQLKSAGVYDNLNVVIFSDHGMMQFKPDNAIMVQNYLNISAIDLNKSIFGIVSNIYTVLGLVKIFLRIAIEKFISFKIEGKLCLSTTYDSLKY